MKKQNPFTKAAIKIAKQTLHMTDEGVHFAGGPNKDEARETLRKNGYSDRTIRRMSK